MIMAHLTIFFPDYLLYFHLLSPTWQSFGISGREQIYVSAPSTY